MSSSCNCSTSAFLAEAHGFVAPPNNGAMIAKARNAILKKIALGLVAIVLIATMIVVGVASWAPNWLRMVIMLVYVVALMVALSRSSRAFRNQIFPRER